MSTTPIQSIDMTDDEFMPIAGPSSYSSAIPPKPQPKPVNAKNIPAEMKEWNHWIVWNYEWSPKKQVWDKPPTSVKTGRHASTKQSKDWVSFDEAMAYYDRHHCDGIGFVFRDTPFIGVDFDGMLRAGVLDVYAQQICRMLDNPYCEISPSGTGIHGLAKGKITKCVKKVEKTENGDKYGAEVYGGEDNRYFTVTGDLFPNSGSNIPQVENCSLLEFLIAHVLDANFVRLWTINESNLSETKYATRSEVELALCGYLYQLGCDTADKMIDLCRYSGIAYNDWERKIRDHTFLKVAESARIAPKRELDYTKTGETQRNCRNFDLRTRSRRRVLNGSGRITSR